MFPDLLIGNLSLPEDYSSILNEAIGAILNTSQVAVLETVALSNLKEAFYSQINTSTLKDLNEKDLQDLYLKYIDFIVDIRRKLIKRDRFYQHNFMLKPSGSPSVEAYEEVGYNQLEISPRLFSYAIVS